MTLLKEIIVNLWQNIGIKHLSETVSETVTPSINGYEMLLIICC